MINDGPLKRIPVTNQNLFPENPGYQRPSIPSRTTEKVEFEDVVLVLYWPLELARMNANVYCYDKTGNLRWVVTPTGADSQGSDPYVEIRWDQERSLPALMSSVGSYGVLEMNTGKVSSVGFYP